MDKLMNPDINFSQDLFKGLSKASKYIDFLVKPVAVFNDKKESLKLENNLAQSNKHFYLKHLKRAFPPQLNNERQDRFYNTYKAKPEKMNTYQPKYSCIDKKVPTVMFSNKKFETKRKLSNINSSSPSESFVVEPQKQTESLTSLIEVPLKEKDAPVPIKKRKQKKKVVSQYEETEISRGFNSTLPAVKSIRFTQYSPRKEFIETLKDRIQPNNSRKASSLIPNHNKSTHKHFQSDNKSKLCSGKITRTIVINNPSGLDYKPQYTQVSPNLKYLVNYNIKNKNGRLDSQMHSTLKYGSINVNSITEALNDIKPKTKFGGIKISNYQKEYLFSKFIYDISKFPESSNKNLNTIS